ncbi:MAG: SCP2 sterol-binding domain-containing protein [Candidatus Helarchaeota archaeon]
MDKEKLQVKALLYIMLKSLEEISKVDEDLQDELEDFEAVIGWKLADIVGYQVYKDERITGVIDELPKNPDVILIMEDLSKAAELLRGDLDGTSAYMSGDLKIEGDMQLAMKIGTFTEFIMDYLEPLLKG